MDERVRIRCRQRRRRCRGSTAPTSSMRSIPPMFRAIADAGARLRADRRVRAVVLSRRGPGLLRGPRHRAAGRDHRRRDPSCRSPISRSARTASPTGRSIWCGYGGSCRCRSSPPSTASRSAAASSSRSAPTSDISHPPRGLASSRPNGGWCPTWRAQQLMRHLAREDVVRELTYTARMFSAERGPFLRLRHQARGGSARGGTGNRARDRRPQPRCDPRRETPAQPCGRL